jgi:hypothetical protein
MSEPRAHTWSDLNKEDCRCTVCGVRYESAFRESPLTNCYVKKEQEKKEPMTLEQYLSELEKLCEKATRGPWWNESGVLHCKAPNWTPEVHRCIHPGSFEEEDDAEFAAASRTELPKLLRIVRALLESVPKCLTEDDAKDIAESTLNEENSCTT